MIDELKPYEEYILDIDIHPQLVGYLLLKTKHACRHTVLTGIDATQSGGAFDQSLLSTIQEICQDDCPICKREKR